MSFSIFVADFVNRIFPKPVPVSYETSYDLLANSQAKCPLSCRWSVIDNQGRLHTQ